MSGEVVFTRLDDSDVTRPPMKVTLWREGERVEEFHAISVEYDGDVVEIWTTEGEENWKDNEWDELVIQYDP